MPVASPRCRPRRLPLALALSTVAALPQACADTPAAVRVGIHTPSMEAPAHDPPGDPRSDHDVAADAGAAPDLQDDGPPGAAHRPGPVPVRLPLAPSPDRTPRAALPHGDGQGAGHADEVPLIWQPLVAGNPRTRWFIDVVLAADELSAGGWALQGTRDPSSWVEVRSARRLRLLLTGGDLERALAGYDVTLVRTSTDESTRTWAIPVDGVFDATEASGLAVRVENPGVTRWGPVRVAQMAWRQGEPTPMAPVRGRPVALTDSDGERRWWIWPLPTLLDEARTGAVLWQGDGAAGLTWRPVSPPASAWPAASGHDRGCDAWVRRCVEGLGFGVQDTLACGSAAQVEACTDDGAWEAPVRPVPTLAWVEGCGPGPARCLDDGSSPSHTVLAFSVQAHEVSRDAWVACVLRGACGERDAPLPPRGDGGLPMTGVPAAAALAWCARLGGTLPTRGQWLAAGGLHDGRAHPWGDAPPSCDDGAFAGCGRPWAVGRSPRDVSPWAVHDLWGNVREYIHAPWPSLVLGSGPPPAWAVGGAGEDTGSGNPALPWPVTPGGDDWTGWRCAWPVSADPPSAHDGPAGEVEVVDARTG